MTFSSRVICDPPPPCNIMVRSLSAALWAMPVMISIACLAVSPSKTSSAIAGLFKAKQPPVILAMTHIDMSPAIEPERFRKVAATQRYRSAFDMQLRNEQKFPMKIAYLPEAERVGEYRPVTMARSSNGKSTLKAIMQTATAGNAAVSNETVASIATRNISISTAPLVETRMFDDARVASANMLTADGLTIILSGINPPKPGSKCRRIDGVLLDCSARAEARLSILLIDRRIKCRISAQVQPGVVVGSCQAGKIDMAADLLRQGLANRNTANTNNNTVL